jgi:hypothetical protein
VIFVFWQYGTGLAASLAMIAPAYIGKNGNWMPQATACGGSEVRLIPARDRNADFGT